MGILSVKRQWSKAFPGRESTRHTTHPCDTSDAMDQASMGKQPQPQHRSSPKASIYEHSPCHSGTTLHDPDEAPSTILAATPAAVTPSDTLVQVMTVGDSVITVETHRMDPEQQEQSTGREAKHIFSRPRARTAPEVWRGPVTHGSITTIESMATHSRSRAWSYPQVDWKRLNFVRRARYSADLREARKGKVPCQSSSGSRSRVDDASATTQIQSAHMSGALQGPSQHTQCHLDGADISPRASACLGIQFPEETSARVCPTDSGQCGDEQMERKDSHMPGTEQPKDKSSADAGASNTPDKRSHRSSSFLRHAMTWIRKK